MKTIFKIARLELKTLFSSPIAWLLLVIFMVQNTLGFIEILKQAIVMQGFGSVRIGNDLVGSYVTEKIFGLAPNVIKGGIFTEVVGHWYFYVPLLTMGLVSRELSSGTINLLFSSPVKIREIVLGKFTGIMLYWSTLMGVLLVFVLCGAIFITNFDLPMVLSCLLGIFLLAMLYSAIGLFVSCLTTYQIVAAISTFLVLAALDFFGGLWQGIPFLRDVTNFINTAAHTENFLKGFLVSYDSVYFLVLTAMFLVLAAMVLSYKIFFKPTLVKVRNVLILLTVVLLIGYLASRPQLSLYYDATAFKSNTLTPASQKVLKRLSGPVTITIYDNLFVDYKDIGKPDHVNANIKTWEPYKRFIPGLEIEYVHFYDAQVNGAYPNADKMNIHEAAKKRAKEQKVDLDNYLPPDSIHKLIDLKPFNNSTVMKITNGNKEVFIRRLTDVEQEEYVIANLTRMIEGADTIAFLQGNQERSIVNEGERDYKYALFDHTTTGSLTENGFEPIAHHPELPIPVHIKLLIIADPAKAYTPEALKNIQDYINSGRNLLILKGDNDTTVLSPILKPLGISFMPGKVMQPNKERSANHIKVKFKREVLNDTTYSMDEWLTVSMSDVSAINYRQVDGFKTLPLLVTDPKKAWNKPLESTLDTGRLTFHPEQGDDNRELAVAVALTRQVGKNRQRIAVVGNANMFNMLYGSSYFTRSTLRWFSNGKFPLSRLRPDPVQNVVKLSYKQSDILKYWLLLVVPGFLIIYGSIYILKRRNL